ncbi:N-(5'-phosphoribosyl)anthranilate isomerase [subsurface metagenome]
MKILFTYFSWFFTITSGKPAGQNHQRAIAPGAKRLYKKTMPKIFVKICGITQPAQGRDIATLGGDAIGLVFAKSPRKVTTTTAREIVGGLPDGFPTVGVFVNSTPDEINTVITETGIRYVQLHGSEPPKILAEINAPCIKVFTMRGENWLAEIRAFLDVPGENKSENKPGNLAAVLIDTYNPTLAGGTGESFDWNSVGEARSGGGMDGLPPLVLAGGLKPENIAQAIKLVNPWGVDVSSGVESEPGIKDMDKVEAFIKAVREN